MLGFRVYPLGSAAIITVSFRTLPWAQNGTLLLLAATSRFPPTPSLGGCRLSFFLSLRTSLSWVHKSRITHCVVLDDWLPLSVVLPGGTHVVACVSTACLPAAEQRSAMWASCVLFLSPSADGHLGCLPFWPCGCCCCECLCVSCCVGVCLPLRLIFNWRLSYPWLSLRKTNTIYLRTM